MDINEKKKSNPWAICTNSVGRDDKTKYERCVKKVKKETGYHEGEEKSPVDQIAEMITDDPDVILDLTEEEKKPEDKAEDKKDEKKEEPAEKPYVIDPHVRAARMRQGMATREEIATEFAISEDMGAIGMMAPVREKSPEEIEAEMDAVLAMMGPEAPVKPEVEPEVEPGVVPDAPEPTEPDPFNPTQPAVDPHPKACEY